MKTTEMART